MNIFRIDEPFIFQIFGASGHLAMSKIFPALFTLLEQNRVPKDYYIIGYGRSSMSHEELRSQVRSSLEEKQQFTESLLEEFLSHLFYIQGGYDKEEDYHNANRILDELTGKKPMPRVAYFAVPPSAFQDIVRGLGTAPRYAGEDIRLIMEKPFGVDTASATSLFHYISRYFSEDAIYLLDHYLGKSAVQSILHLRYKNRILDILLKSNHISNIQITASEEEGILNRASYFDVAGTMKDMVQSHLLQLLALTIMAIPHTKSPESIHREKGSILSSLHFDQKADRVVSGQYASYLKEPGVRPDSETETFFATRLFVDREDWYRIPIYLRTGKKLSKKHTYIVVEFQKFAFQGKDEEPNRLIFDLYPNEQLKITFLNQHTSFFNDSFPLTSESSIACMGDDCLPEHARLLLKVIQKDKTYFLSFPEILSAWRLADSLQSVMGTPELYPDHSDGPQSQHALLERDGFQWFSLPL